MQTDFYHLTAIPLERVLPRIAERIVGEGGRLLIVAEAETLLARLDRQLWDQSPSSFLPHARDGGPDDTRQPILLSQSIVAANGARNVALADGQWREAATGFERAFYFFDGDTLEGAREAWRGLGGRENVERRYWKQDGGKWVQGP